MNRTVNCILMLTYLQSGRIYKISELAQKLEWETGEKVNPRNIIEYRKELEYVGFLIETIPGKFGGYRLSLNKDFPVLNITDEEKKALMEAYHYVSAKSDFMSKDFLDKAMGKIFSSVHNDKQFDDYISVEQYQLTMKDPELKERFEFIRDCIQEKHQIEILYASLKSGNKIHVLHPYKLFIYNNTWFFFAWNPETTDVRVFKLNRIVEFKKLDQKFTVWSGFNPRDYLDEYGFKNNGTRCHIELIAKGTRARLLKERVYGRNQVLEPLDEDRVKVSLDLQNESVALSFALQGGTELEILEPQWLIDQIKDTAKQILETYGNQEENQEKKELKNQACQPD